MADQHSSKKPVRAEPVAGLAGPTPDREEPGAKQHKDQPAVSESSEDEDGEVIEHNQGQDGDMEPNVPNREKSQSGSRPQSRHASSFANAGIVPRSQRRGLLGRLTVLPEVERPYEYNNKTKWMITAIVALA